MAHDKIIFKAAQRRTIGRFAKARNFSSPTKSTRLLTKVRNFLILLKNNSSPAAISRPFASTSEWTNMMASFFNDKIKKIKDSFESQPVASVTKKDLPSGAVNLVSPLCSSL